MVETPLPDDDLATPITFSEVVERARQLPTDAELGAALREALATAPPNVDLQVSRTGEVCLCDDLVPVTDATRRLAALLTRSATQETTE